MVHILGDLCFQSCLIDCCQVGRNFHGRFFGGRQLSVQFFPLHVYVRKFPEAAGST